MEKLAVGPLLAGKVRITDPIEQTVPLPNGRSMASFDECIETWRVSHVNFI